MNIFLLLKSEKMSPNEKIVADFILEQPTAFLNMNAKQISKTCFVSVATIYRLCERLNLGGLSELKLKVSSSLESYLQLDEGFDYDFPVQENNSPIQIGNQLSVDYQKTVETTLNLFDEKEIRKIVKAMDKADAIDVYTSAGNIYFAQNFMFQMNEIGKTVNVPIEEYHQRLCAASSDKRHIAVIISFGGRGLLVENIAKILVENGTPIIFISSFDFKMSNVKTDFNLYMSPYENHYKKISSFSTRLSLLYLLDVIYTCYFELDHQNNIAKKLDYYSKIRRIK